jgi:hypothetical protein
LADKAAAPFIKQRLQDLAARYEDDGLKPSQGRCWPQQRQDSPVASGRGSQTGGARNH